jgi:hypothetical protein
MALALLAMASVPLVLVAIVDYIQPRRGKLRRQLLSDPIRDVAHFPSCQSLNVILSTAYLGR